jgi:hypothetical protein
METHPSSSFATVSPTDSQGRPARRWLERGVALFSTWFVVGLYLDGWAHIRGLPESFFTPWHGFLYAGYFGAAAALTTAWFVAVRRGAPWRQALPAGFGLSLLGVVIFLIAGLADMIWHGLFGIENSIAALYSPPHLVLATAGALIATGPLRAAWKDGAASLTRRWRAVLSLLLLLAIFTFFTAESHAFVHPWASAKFRPADLGPAALGLPPMPAGGVGTQDIALTLGVSSILFQTVMLMGMVLLMIRRWGATLPAGWLTFVLLLNTAGLSILHSTFWTVPVALLAGLGADVLYRRLKPETQRFSALRIFSAAVPVILYATYFVALGALGGTWWPVHVWAGSIVLAGIVGWLVSYLLLPSPLPAPARQVPASG